MAATRARRVSARRNAAVAREGARAEGIIDRLLLIVADSLSVAGCLKRADPRGRAPPFRLAPITSPMPAAKDLAAALAYSRYATHMLVAYPDERARLEATVDAPYAWGAARAEVADAVDSGDA